MPASKMINFLFLAMIVFLTVLLWGTSSVYALNPDECDKTNQALLANKCQSDSKQFKNGCKSAGGTVVDFCKDSAKCTDVKNKIDPFAMCENYKGIDAKISKGCYNMVDQWLKVLSDNQSNLCKGNLGKIPIHW